MKRRYVIVGVGVRGINMFLRPLVQTYTDVAEVVGLCDTNPKRLEAANELVGTSLPVFTDFDEMMRKVDCDAVIVTSVDATHHRYIIGALEAGKDVITEKPMTIDDVRCRAILEAERSSTGRVIVTFNYRYAPYNTRITELLKSGVIGRVHSVEFSWYLDTIHGADYFRRWHRRKENSGGLFVHKATHHFDLVNWWLEQKPVKVYATGSKNFYRPDRQERGERCSTCRYTNTCEFFFDLNADPVLRKLYVEAESEDGYYRDRCVFDPDIDIEDTMGAVVTYSGGTQLTYSLHAFSPFEGWRIAFNGSEGRLEAGVWETFYPSQARLLPDRKSVRRSMDPALAARGQMETLRADEIRIYPLYGGARIERVPRVKGGHGGGDERLLDMLFRGDVPDPLGHAAGSEDGAMSILTGVAANRSIETGRAVYVQDLLTGAETVRAGA